MKKGMFHGLKELTNASFRKCFIKSVKIKGTFQSPSVPGMNYRVNNSKNFVWWTGRACSSCPSRRSYQQKGTEIVK